MKKMKFYAVMAAAALAAAGTTIPAQAAGISGKNCYIKVIAVPDWCLPDIPAAPEIPEQPDSPAAPEIPEQPDSPTAPEIPEQPESPEIPDTPVLPDEDSSYAAQVVRLVNEERAKEGLSALTADAGLEAAGNVRAKEIVSSFSHTRPNGSGFATAIQEQGVSYRSSGENIAWGQRSPEEVVDAWMNSPGHRANIMNPQFTRIGVGYYQNDAGTNYWAQLFAD